LKVRGHRIEPGEIEAALAAHPTVRESLVLVKHDARGRERLVAYVIPAQGAEINAAGLRAFLKQRLPEYMIPAAIAPVAAWPLTPGGKLDRGALPEPEIRTAEMDALYVVPRTHLEKEITAIWRQVLGVEKVGLNDNFFDLGGHSLLMAEIFARLTQVTNQELTMIELFEYPTVGALAQFLSRHEAPPNRAPQGAATKQKEGRELLREQFRRRQQGGKKS
jgi:acyl carrier protein